MPEDQDKIDQYEKMFASSSIPTRSSGKYIMEYDKFLAWSNNEVTERTIKAYMVYNKEEGKAPSTLFSYQTYIKKCSLSNGLYFSEVFWNSIINMIKDYQKNYVGKPVSKEFQHNDLKEWSKNAPDSTFVDIQRKLAVYVAHNGALRVNENYSLTFDDLEVDKKNEEITITIKKELSKNGEERRFMIKDSYFFSLFLKYQAKIGNRTKFLWPLWNNRYKIFNNQRRGQRWFQMLVKEVAKDCGLQDPESYTHHSFRRGAASAAFTENATVTQIKHLGGWKSTSVAESYVYDSVESRRNMAKKVKLSEEPESKGKKRKASEVVVENNTVKKKIEVNESSDEEDSKLVQIFKNCTIHKIVMKK